MKIPEETRAALAACFSRSDGELVVSVNGLDVTERQPRSFDLAYDLTVTRKGHDPERWEVTLCWDDKSQADLFETDGRDPERVRMLAFVVQPLIQEWWDTKARNRQSAKMGRQIH
ncbi:hypothetical protein ACGILS_29300 [Streptomyces albidoflavus]|uniref:hypothetical protein n=1 Tax=Streptomyces albidoflavus TaxID=1886 RepID=UPI0021D603F8|nr:hypothetical protein [Streptomyces albidoflavus]MCU7702823.1 hypothetical protein [Streptomyces albidoflavus]